ncbi:3-oxoacid CoA-transferase subunit B [Pikeienuella piscinae]|uniref:3-oxoacid CoA-transferase subunit B n=1 Tax=Pikeienuella piscinae TaxID=2748098 RepID=A0A7L5BTW0_9RHOB|nr:3-oxoacid CoA-transferase subunit B [Pikeienuella piscinae]QIE54018.1 3-oxoacid CoA-transferase subunit B [Pikeienuella piscinae]
MNVTTDPARLSRAQIAWRAAQDIPDGAYVNLGIGMPVACANHLPEGREVIFQSENGILGVGPAPLSGEEDYDLINASKQPVTLLPGAAIVHHADSFAMITGGHIDIAVLGAFEVASNGDLANWSTGKGGVPGVGGAMDLAAGAKAVWALTTHASKSGAPKLVDRLKLPLTGAGVVKRVYTDLAVIELDAEGFLLREMVPGLDIETLRGLTGAPLRTIGEPHPLEAPGGL